MKKEYEVFELEDKQIDELIQKLKELKKMDGHVHFSIKNGELLIHHGKDEYQ